MPEEEVFAVLVQIMQQHRMRDMFKPSMAELGLCMYQLENLVQEQIPELHVHFQSQVSYQIWFYLVWSTHTNL
jgi:ecotropic viral integration site 5 protein